MQVSPSVIRVSPFFTTFRWFDSAIIYLSPQVGSSEYLEENLILRVVFADFVIGSLGSRDGPDTIRLGGFVCAAPLRQVKDHFESLIDCMQVCPFFRDFSREALEEIACHTQQVQYFEGHKILEEGMTNTYLYFLMSGSVGIYHGKDIVVTLYRRGDTIGEMSVIDKKPCTASVLTREPSTLLRIEASRLLGNKTTAGSGQFNSQLYQTYAEILKKKLVDTNERAKEFERANASLEATQWELNKANRELEAKVLARTADLKNKNDLLEAQCAELRANQEKLTDMYQTQEKLFENLSELSQSQQDTMDGALSSYLQEEKALRNRRVLLAEPKPRDQKVAKLALGGTGVCLDIASSLEEAKAFLDRGSYDVLCIGSELVSLATYAQERGHQSKNVLLSHEETQGYLKQLRAHPHLTNIVTRDSRDQVFTVRSLLTTVRKLLGKQIFGLEKYLAWGADIRSHEVTESSLRASLREEMGQTLRSFGVRGRIVERAQVVVEELLMNAIYDAPCDAQGKSLYNHLPRTQAVSLKREECAELRYACDGTVLAVSVSDPFGALNRETLLKYLESCYAQVEIEDASKGGAGRGLHLIMETADLVVFNVQESVRTEVIALFNVDPTIGTSGKNRAFQYFFVEK